MGNGIGAFEKFQLRAHRYDVDDEIQTLSEKKNFLKN